MRTWANPVAISEIPAAAACYPCKIGLHSSDISLRRHVSESIGTSQLVLGQQLIVSQRRQMPHRIVVHFTQCNGVLSRITSTFKIFNSKDTQTRHLHLVCPDEERFVQKLLYCPNKRASTTHSSLVYQIDPHIKILIHLVATKMTIHVCCSCPTPLQVGSGFSHRIMVSQSARVCKRRWIRA